MNNDYYRQVLEDVQKDLADVEQSVSELHGIERYVQRKMDADADESGNGNGKVTYDQYQALLDDVRQDVDNARSKIGELRGVGNFAREKLKAAGVEVGEVETAKPSQDGKAEPPAEQSGQVDTMHTVQFGPDGFPMSK